MSNEDKPVKKSVAKERQRIANAVVDLVARYGYKRQARTAWQAVFPDGPELRDENGRTLDSVRSE